MFGSASRKAKKLAEARDVEGLLQLLGSDDPKEREAAANGLSMLRDEPNGPRRDRVISALMRAAGDTDSDVRGQAIFSLGELHSREAADLLVRSLSDQDQWIRLFAVVAVSRIRDVRAVPRLIELLADEEPLVRQQVAWALSEFGGAEVEAALRRTMASEREEDVRSAAEESLRRITS